MALHKTVYKRIEYAKKIAAGYGGIWPRYYMGAFWCHYIHGASPENYFVLRFFALPERAKKNYLTSGRSKEADDILNSGSSLRDKELLGKKQLFNHEFAGLNHRGFLYAPDAGDEEIARFIRKYPQFFLKPVGKSMGSGIKKIKADELKDTEAFIRECRSKKLLMEECIRQHTKLNEIHAESVNTIRIIAARDSSGKVQLIGGALRCGVEGAVVDNFHSGGIAYPLQLENGMVCGAGRDNTTLWEYVRHPGSACRMAGFQIPHWEKVKEAVCQAMNRVPSLGYVGWDMAVLEDGVEIIEGNYNWPGGNIIQFDGIGKYPLVKSCFGGRSIPKLERGSR